MSNLATDCLIWQQGMIKRHTYCVCVWSHLTQGESCVRLARALSVDLSDSGIV